MSSAFGDGVESKETSLLKTGFVVAVVVCLPGTKEVFFKYIKLRILFRNAKLI